MDWLVQSVFYESIKLVFFYGLLEGFRKICWEYKALSNCLRLS